MIASGIGAVKIDSFLKTGELNAPVYQSISTDRLKEFLSIFYMPVVGASGAVYGVLVAFGFLFPNAKLALIFFPVPIKAKFFIPLILLGDLFFGVTRYSIGNVAHFAHIGGALTGLIIILYIKYWNKFGGNYEKVSAK